MLDLSQLDWMELAETANELCMRNRDEALCVERALVEEGRRDCNFKTRSTYAGGMGHERCERAIFVAGTPPRGSHT